MDQSQLSTNNFALDHQRAHTAAAATIWNCRIAYIRKMLPVVWSFARAYKRSVYRDGLLIKSKNDR